MAFLSFPTSASKMLMPIVGLVISALVATYCFLLVFSIYTQKNKKYKRFNDFFNNFKLSIVYGPTITGISGSLVIVAIIVFIMIIKSMFTTSS